MVAFDLSTSMTIKSFSSILYLMDFMLVCNLSEFQLEVVNSVLTFPPIRVMSAEITSLIAVTQTSLIVETGRSQ